MSRKILALALVVVFAFTMLLAGCGDKAATTSDNSGAAASTATQSTTDAKTELTVGFIYVGPIGDGGYTYAHDQGRLYLEKELGPKGVKTIYKESVPEGPDVEKAMKDMIDQGAKAIFATSFGYMDYVEKVAKEYPDIKFFHCSGYKMGDNFSKYFGRMYQPRYLSGIVAGMKTKSDKIGFVGAFEIPEVIGGIDAFALGVQSVNPDAKVYVKWTHTWYDPAKEKDAAKALLAEGCDVIAQHQDTAGPQQAAEEAGKWSIGYNSDMTSKAPKAYMTAPVWNWGPYYVEQVKAIMDGTWKASDYYGGMKEGIVELAPLTANAPEGAQTKIDEVTAKIKDGSFKVYEGPIYDQTGKLRVKQGEYMSDKDILSVDWFVKGVEGKIEKTN